MGGDYLQIASLCQSLPERCEVLRDWVHAKRTLCIDSAVVLHIPASKNGQLTSLHFQEEGAAVRGDLPAMKSVSRASSSPPKGVARECPRFDERRHVGFGPDHLFEMSRPIR